jgi:hypothetical protein
MFAPRPLPPSVHALAVGLSLVFVLCAASAGCHRSADSDVRRANTAATRDDDDDEDAEKRETQEELAMRRQAFDSLTRYRSASCAAAVAKIEALLNRALHGAKLSDDTPVLPEDLLTALSEAELWWKEGRQLCNADAQRERFEALHSAMDALWRYPTTVSRDDLLARLRAAGLET